MNYARVKVKYQRFSGSPTSWPTLQILNLPALTTAGPHRANSSVFLQNTDKYGILRECLGWD